MNGYSHLVLPLEMDGSPVTLAALSVAAVVPTPTARRAPRRAADLVELRD